MTPVPHTVGSLMAALADLPDDLPIIVAADEEGNGFERLYDVEVGKCYNIDNEINSVHPDDYDEYSDLFDAVVLWP